MMKVCILDTKELIKAQLAQAKLESYGIYSELKTNDAGGLLPHLRWAEGIQLYVLEQDLDRSLEVMSSPKYDY